MAEMERLTTAKGAVEQQLGDVSEALRGSRSAAEDLAQQYASLKEQHANFVATTQAAQAEAAAAASSYKAETGGKIAGWFGLVWFGLV